MGEVTPLMGSLAEEQPADAAALADALRFADALDRAEDSRDADIDPREDPALAGLLTMVSALRGPIAEATDGQSFRSFHHRSRAAILHSLEAERVPANISTFRVRASRLWYGLAGTAAAAAIGLLALGNPSAGTGTSGVANLTVSSTTDELDRMAAALTTIQQHRERGDSVPASLFREVVETSARMSNLIEQRPDVISRQAVTTYANAVAAGAQVLETATADPGAEGALAAAQRAAKDGAVVATRFLAAQPTPTATATPTGTATATPTGIATAKPTGTATATPTGTPTSTPTATPTGTPTSTPTATPTATGTPSASPTPTGTPDDGDIIRR